MDDIVILDGHELKNFLWHMRDEGLPAIYQLSFAIDGGIKIKVNQGCWSAPLGRYRDQECNPGGTNGAL